MIHVSYILYSVQYCLYGSQLYNNIVILYVCLIWVWCIVSISYVCAV